MLDANCLSEKLFSHSQDFSIAGFSVAMWRELFLSSVVKNRDL